MRRILILLFLVALFVFPVSAIDWTYGNPTGLGLTNIPSDQFIVTNNNASTGDISSVSFNPVGTYTQLLRINNCNNCLYGLINPIDGSLWGSDEQGNIFYTTNLFGTIDYSAGFFTAGFGGSCSGVGGNCNPLIKNTVFTPTTYSIKLTVDTEGNIYSYDGLVVKKFVRSLDYSVQTITTVTVGYTGSGTIVQIPNVVSDCIDQTCVFRVLDIQVDSTGNIHLLIGATVGALSANDVPLVKAVISNSGALIKTEILDGTRDLSGGSGQGFLTGGLILDTLNQNSNYSYGFNLLDFGSILKQYLLHNSSSGTIDIGGGELTLNSLNSIGYNNFQIYVSSPTDNLIRSYSTNFEGYGLSSIAPNPSGITGTFSWVNGYNTQINTITPGAALSYRWTISENNENYTYFSGWSPSSLTEPTNIQELTDLTLIGPPSIFLTNSNTLAGTNIFGFLLAKRKNDSTWSQLAAPTKLTISPSVAGFDSITLSKTFYNLTGDTIQATLTYSSGYPPYFYQWQLCSRADCADGRLLNTISLISQPSSSSMSTSGMAAGNYYAVMMRHLPFLQNEIVASQRLEIRPPVIGVSWDKTTYNLYPKSLPSVCLDSTPSTSYFTNISGYAGLQIGWFSCGSTPADASANNSIMRGSLYAKYNGTFYLNNSLGNVWNGTLNNGSGALIYTLTNSSPTETWTLTGINQSGETFFATTEVEAESLFGYSLSVSPNPAYNQNTLYLTFTKPIYAVSDYVQIKDAGGLNLVAFKPSDKAGSYYIDPSKQYTYGTWTAFWTGGGVLNQLGSSTQGQTVYTFTVKNAGKPSSNGSIVPADSASYTSSAIGQLLQSTTFWGLIIVIGIMFTVSMIEKRGK